MRTDIFEDIGLTKGETKVYLALLELGESTTGPIIERSQLSGGKIYIILDKLMQKGLVNYITKQKTKYFSAANPQKILSYVDDKEKQLQDKRKEIEKQLPLLLPKTKDKKYDSQLFLGYEGIKTAAFETLRKISKQDEICIMGIDLSRDEKFNIMWKHWHTERIKKGNNCKMLFSDDTTNNFKSMKKTECKVIEGIAPASIGIVGNYILLTTYTNDPSCLVIKNPELVASFRTFFDTLWQNARSGI